MRVSWAVAVAMAILVSGCMDQSEAPEAPGDDVAPTTYQDDRIKIEDVGDDEFQPPTLEEPPRWQRGEYWEIRLTDFFVHQSYTSHRVVAGAEDEDFLVGMPNHDFSNDLMVLHVPGFGQVSKATLGYEVHDCPYQPLQFPLELDATWQTQFECRDVTATVIEVTETTATVELVGSSDHITLTYDAEMRAITHMLLEGYAEYEVTGHGMDFLEDKPELDTIITVPHMHDVIFQHGRVAGGALSFGNDPLVASPAGGVNPLPEDVVAVDPTYDRVSFVIILGNLWGLAPQQAGPLESPAGGYYKTTAEAPDGEVYDLELLPDNGAEFHIATYKHDKPGGDWSFEHIAAGPGLAMAEGIAYHVYDIDIADGRILPSVGEHQHGTGDGH